MNQKAHDVTVTDVEINALIDLCLAAEAAGIKLKPEITWVMRRLERAYWYARGGYPVAEGNG